jgi:hypothetical protein
MYKIKLRESAEKNKDMWEESGRMFSLETKE